MLKERPRVIRRARLLAKSSISREETYICVPRTANQLSAKRGCGWMNSAKFEDCDHVREEVKVRSPTQPDALNAPGPTGRGA
jgi:hypothetical protein